MANGITSYDKGHNHVYIINELGNGKTTMDNDHIHEIIRFEILRAQGHTHTIGLINKLG